MRTGESRNFEIKNGEKLTLLTTLIALCCIPIFTNVTETYGFADDYALLEQALKNNISWGWNEFSVQGRPVVGWLIKSAFFFVQDISDLWLVRALGLFLNALLTLFLFNWLLKQKYHPLSAFSFSTLFFFSPALIINTSWALCFPYSLAILSSFIAGDFAWKSCAKIKGKTFHIITSILLIIFALSIHQPCGMAFLVPIWIRLDRTSLNKDDVLKTFKALVLCFTAIGVYFILYKSALLYVTDTDVWGAYTGRGSLTDDPISKLKYFTCSILPLGLSFWGFLLSDGIKNLFLSSSVLLLIAYFLLRIKSSDQRHRRIGLIPIFILFVTLSVLPILVIEDNQSPIRVLPILYLILLCPLLVLTQAFLESFRRTTSVITLLFVSTIALTGSYLSKTRLVEPRKWEFLKVNDYLTDYFPDKWPKYIATVRPYGYKNPFEQKVYQEYGSSATWSSWGVRSLVKLLLLEKFSAERDNFSDKEVFVLPENPFSHKIRIPVLNMEHALFGKASQNDRVTYATNFQHEVLGDLWNTDVHNVFVSEWLGLFYSDSLLNSPQNFSLFSPSIGILKFNTSTSDGIWFVHEQIGWFWTTAEAFPWVYLKNSKRWYPFEFDESGLLIIK